MPDTRALLEEVARAARLQEGPEGVAQVIRLVGSSGRVALRDLSRSARLPVPVLAAVRRELEARGILTRDGGLRLSSLGERVLADLGGPWTSPACPTCAGTGIAIPDRYSDVLLRLEALWARRPIVDVALDQSFALPQSNLRRCLYALDRGAVLGRRVLFLGDDDAGSIAALLLARELGSEVHATALDLDERVLEYVHGAAEAEGVDVELVRHDVREPLPERLMGRFDTVFTDPPYTLPGLELFLSRALGATGGRSGRHVFLSFGPRPPEESAEVLRALGRMGLALAELRPGFNRYEGASVLAGTSDLYHLLVTPDSRPTITGRDERGIYTGEIRPRTRQYACKACGAVYGVGPGDEWPTIEALKATGCPRCGGRSFEQRRRRPPR